jgi:hypothetical protein
MSTIYCEEKYVQRLLTMKKAGKLQSLENIINYDNGVDLRDECKEANLALWSFEEV